MEWNIQSRSHTCHECSKPFEDREALHTLLSMGNEGLDRQDLCVACWDQHHAEGGNHRRGFISHWKNTYLAPAPVAEVIRKESAETLLRQLIDRNRREDDSACFVLAVMLERKRLLKLRGRSVQDGRRLQVYEHAKSGDVFTVWEVELRLDELEAVQRRVADLLERGLTEGSDPDPAASTPSDSASEGDEATAPEDAQAPTEPDEDPPVAEDTTKERA